jgi:predicted transcriptional regulator
MASILITLPPETYKQLKHIAVDAGTSARAIVRQAVEEFLKRRGGRRSK